MSWCNKHGITIFSREEFTYVIGCRGMRHGAFRARVRATKKEVEDLLRVKLAHRTFLTKREKASAIRAALREIH